MNTKLTFEKTNQRRQREWGVSLIECIAYAGLFFMVAALGFKLFYACWDNAKGMRRNTGAIAETLGAGERWREEVRHATGALRVENSDGGELVRIPQHTGEIDYRFGEGALWRRAGSEGEWTLALDKVKASRMTADARQQVTAWRWELELKTTRKEIKLSPWFTFEAVPQNKF